MAQDRAGELGEEALDQVEPGAVLGREGELEAAGRSSGKPSCCLPRDVCGMIIEDQLDRGAGRISGVEKLEEFDELLLERFLAMVFFLVANISLNTRHLRLADRERTISSLPGKFAHVRKTVVDPSG